VNIFSPTASTSEATPPAAQSSLETGADSLSPAAAEAKAKRISLGAIRPSVLQRIGGLPLLAAPVLLTAGMLTSPEQAGPGTDAYIKSLAADPALSLWSANLLHYGWVALALAAFATLGLLRGPRGRVFLSIAATMLCFGAIQMSGLLLSDWFLVSAGNTLSIEDAVLMNEAALEGSVEIWRMSGMIGGILGIGLLSLALAKAKAISWWIAPLGFLPWVVPALGLGAIGALIAFACYLPLLIAGGRLISAR
jgi:hypothetical protein